MRYRKLAGRLIVALLALLLAMLGPTLFLSFEYNAWVVDGYSAAEPLAVLALGAIATVIAVAMFLSVASYRAFRRKLIAFFITWALGAMTIGAGTGASWLLFLNVTHAPFTLPFLAMTFLLSLLAVVSGLMLAPFFNLAPPDPSVDDEKLTSHDEIPDQGIQNKWHRWQLWTSHRAIPVTS